MMLADFAAWSQIVASFGVVITLIYLAIQVRQGAEVARAGSREAMMGHTQQEILASLDHPDIFIAIVRDEAPTDEMKVRIFCWLTVTMRARA